MGMHPKHASFGVEISAKICFRDSVITRAPPFRARSETDWQTLRDNNKSARRRDSRFRRARLGGSDECRTAPPSVAARARRRASDGMGAKSARGRWTLAVAILLSLVAAAAAHASGPRAARRALRADVPTSVTGESSLVTDADADPDASSSSIDAALVRRVAGDAGCVIVTWANDHYRDFARSWVGNLRALGLSNFMVGAMDAELHSFLSDCLLYTSPSPRDRG